MQFNVSKQELRKIYLSKRQCVGDKDKKSTEIFSKLYCDKHFKEAHQVLLYASVKGEVETFGAAKEILKNKKVAFPYCLDKNGHMDFYYINDLDDLESGKFGILEPNILKCKKVTDFSKSIIIVPAVAFDEQGYRLGYGGGYYDRFLEKYNLFSIGLCYNELIAKRLPVEKYDKPVNAVITETAIYKNY